MSKNRRPTSDKSSDGVRPLTVMPAKVAETPKPDSVVPSDAWLGSLINLGARLAAPPAKAAKNHP